MERKRRLPDSVRKVDEPSDSKKQCIRPPRELRARLPLCCIYNTFNDLRLRNLMYDRVIRTNDNREIPAHAIVLSLASPYFQKELCTTWNDGDLKSNRINIDLPEKIMRQVINVTYTGHCKITQENVQQLLVAASTFCFQEVVQECYTFILHELTSQNCIDYFKFSQLYFLNELTGNILKYILHHFREVYYTNKQFVELTADELLRLLEHDELNVALEETLFECIMRWVDFDCQQREQHWPTLVKSLRFGTMNITYFMEKVLTSHYVVNNPEVYQYIIQVQRHIMSLDLPKEEREKTNTELDRARIPQEVLLVFGGWSGAPEHNYSLVEVYDVCARQWHPMRLGEVEREYYYHGVCILQDRVYMVGGCSDSLTWSTTNRMRCFDPKKRLWEDRANMYEARSNLSCVELDGYLYAIGGFDRFYHLDTVERYDPVANQWTMMASMYDARSEASAACLYGKVFVAGGFATNDVLRSVESYDPATNTWTIITPMCSPRYGLCLVAYRDALYALGGNDGLGHLDTMEKYNPVTAPYWVGVADMTTKRKDFAAVVLDDKIYAIGGSDEWSTVTSSESYDGDVDQWEEESRMTQRRCGLAACVLRGLDNAHEYSHNTYKQKLEEELKRKKEKRLIQPPESNESV